MPIVTTGIPFISALGQSGAEFGQLPEYYRRRRREQLEDEILGKREREHDEEREADKAGGEAVLEAMIPDEFDVGGDQPQLQAGGMPPVGAGAGMPGAPAAGPQTGPWPPAPVGGPMQGAAPGAPAAPPQMPVSSSPFGYHNQEMGDLARKQIALARKIAPNFGRMSRGMQLALATAFSDSFKTAHDELQRNHMIEAAQHSAQLGAYGNPESDYSKKAVAYIVSLAQAGDMKGATAAMDKLSEPVFRRQQDQDHRMEKVAQATQALQMAKQGGLKTDNAEILMRKYAAGVGSDAQFDADFPELLLGHAKALDGSWHVNQQAADTHDSMVEQLIQAKIAETQANAKESLQRGEYMSAQAGPKGWLGKALEFAQKSAEQGMKREQARAEIGAKLYAAFGKRTDPKEIDKILDRFFPPVKKHSLKRNATGQALIGPPTEAPTGKMSLARDEESGEVVPDDEAVEGETPVGPVPTLAEKPEKVLAHLDALPDDMARLSWLQEQSRGKLGDKAQMDLALDIMRSYGGGKLWTLYKSLKKKAQGGEE